MADQQPRRPDWLGVLFFVVAVLIFVLVLCGGTVSAALWPVYPPAIP